MLWIMRLVLRSEIPTEFKSIAPDGLPNECFWRRGYRLGNRPHKFIDS